MSEWEEFFRESHCTFERYGSYEDDTCEESDSDSSISDDGMFFINRFGGLHWGCTGI